MIKQVNVGNQLFLFMLTVDWIFNPSLYDNITWQWNLLEFWITGNVVDYDPRGLPQKKVKDIIL